MSMAFGRAPWLTPIMTTSALEGTVSLAITMTAIARIISPTPGRTLAPTEWWADPKVADGRPSSLSEWVSVEIGELQTAPLHGGEPYPLEA